MSTELRLFGPVSVIINDRRLGPRDFGGRKAKQILEILALSQGRLVSKDKLIHSLWNDDTPQDVAGCLEHYVSLLRRQLRVGNEPGPAIVLTEHRGYRLAADGVWVDVSAFDALDGACGTAADRPLVESALALMPAELLEDEPYADWAITARSHYGQRRLELLGTAADLALHDRDFGAAARWSRAAVGVDALNEASHRCLMLAHYARGDRVEALRVFADLSRALVDELGVDATRAVTALHTAILNEVPFDELLPARRSAIDVPQRQPNLESAPHQVPYLGRDAQLIALHAACTEGPADSGSGPVIAVVEGGTGLGKSRLLHEVAARMAEHAVRTVSCDPGMQDVRGALIEEIVTAVLGGHARTAMLANGFSNAVQEDSVSLAAVRELERLLATVDRFVVMIDDAQWADAFSVRLLSYLAGRSEGVRGAFVLAVDDAELRPEYARLARRASCRIKLGPLSAEDLDPLGMADVHAATGGHPVAVVAHAQAASGRPAEIPEPYRRAVFDRVRALGETAWRVAVASAVTEQPCGPTGVAAVLNADPLDVVEMQDRLCGVGVLEPVADGFTFRNPLVRTLLRDTVSPVRLRVMRQFGASPPALHAPRISRGAATSTGGS